MGDPIGDLALDQFQPGLRGCGLGGWGCGGVFDFLLGLGAGGEHVVG